MQAERNERDGIFVVSDKGRVARRHTSDSWDKGKDRFDEGDDEWD